jgi:hypothetical protein
MHPAQKGGSKRGIRGHEDRRRAHQRPDGSIWRTSPHRPGQALRLRTKEDTMDLQYQLKAGSYYLYDLRDKPSAVTGERRFRLKTDLVAIAFDLFTGEVHQHGNPTRIQSWAAHHRRRLRAAGALAQANELVVVSGPLPVDELNKCLRIRGYCRRMFKRLAHLPHGKLQR